MNYTELAEISQNKTRVILFGVHHKILEIVRYILDYHCKTYDFINENEISINGEDFIILETNNENDLKNFPPTILFIGSYTQIENYEPLISQITAGGILVYPNFIQSLDRVVLQSVNYFKKYEYKEADVTVSNEKAHLNTEFGKLELPTELEILKDIEGAKHFCQQLGVMEDEFYDALSTWK